jgi:anti-sigma factor RsiW
MSAHDPERISLYLDGELSPAEAGEVEEHLAGCSRCRSTYDAFVQLRTLLQKAEPVQPVDELAQRRALREILRDRPPIPFLRRPVTLPAPGLAALVGALVVALGTLVAERLPFRHEAPSPQTASKAPERPAEVSGGFDPESFDRGGRLETYIAIHPKDEEF